MSLYKYVTKERSDILKNKMIRFTQPGAFNDPFEMKPHYTGITPYEEMVAEVYLDLPNKVREEIQKIINVKIPDKLIKEFIKIKTPELNSMISEVSDIGTDWINTNMQTKLGESFGLLCLTEKPDNLLMWAHYTNAHSGMVIIFDENQEFFNQNKSKEDELRHLRKVRYSEIRPNKLVRDGNFVDLFITKSKDWEYEQEWRILLPLERATEIKEATPFDIYLFRIPPEAISGIIFGCRTEKQFEKSVLELIGNSSECAHIKIFKAAEHKTKYALSIVEY